MIADTGYNIQDRSFFHESRYRSFVVDVILHSLFGKVVLGRLEEVGTAYCRLPTGVVLWGAAHPFSLTIHV
jgi:hypothetical protein